MPHGSDNSHMSHDMIVTHHTGVTILTHHMVVTIVIQHIVTINLSHDVDSGRHEKKHTSSILFGFCEGLSGVGESPNADELATDLTGVEGV